MENIGKKIKIVLLWIDEEEIAKIFRNGDKDISKLEETMKKKLQIFRDDAKKL